MLVVEVLCEFGNALCIGLRLELVAFGLQEGLKLLVVCDDAVMDDRKFPGRVGTVRVTVEARRGTVGGPTGVGNTGV